MKRKVTIYIAAILALILIFAFVKMGGKNNGEDKSNAGTNQNNGTNKNAEAIESEEYYLITKEDNQYFYVLYGKNKSEVFSGGPLPKQPKITMAEEQVIRVTIQAGTGIATQSGYYYSIENNIFSPTFQSIFDEFKGLVVYATSNKVVVQNIFNKSDHYQEFSLFSYPFSEVAFPFVDVRFLEDGSGIRVRYLTGENYAEVSQEFALKKD